MTAAAAIVAAIIALFASGGVAWNAIGNHVLSEDSSERVATVNELAKASPELAEVWNSLDESQKYAMVNEFDKEFTGLGNLFGIAGGGADVLDTDRLLAELSDYSDMQSAYEELGDAPIYEDYFNQAQEQIAAQNQAEFDELDRLLAEQEGLRDAELESISRTYGDARTGILSNQFQQNLDTMSALQSDMSRARRNALEAGASAGIRIAGNVNALLSAQNKQAATSMDTANQLSQMMINQRAAESSANQAYTDYLTSDNAQRRDLRLSSESRAHDLAQGRYNVAQDSYNAQRAKLDDQYKWSGLYDFRSTKSKYSTNESGQ